MGDPAEKLDPRKMHLVEDKKPKMTVLKGGKDEKPGHIADMELFHEKYLEAKEIADTTEADKGLLYHLALNEIRDEKTGRIKYNLLDKKFGDKYHHKVADAYISGLKDLLKAKGFKGSDLEMDHYVESLYGETKTNLLNMFARYGKDYTLKAHTKEMDEYIKSLRQRLMPLAAGHLKSDNFAKIMKEIKADKHLGVLKDNLDTVNNPLFRTDVGNLIAQFYENEGVITPNSIRDSTQYLSQYASPGKEVKLWPKEPAK